MSVPVKELKTVKVGDLYYVALIIMSWFWDMKPQITVIYFTECYFTFINFVPSTEGFTYFTSLAFIHYYYCSYVHSHSKYLFFIFEKSIHFNSINLEGF